MARPTKLTPAFQERICKAIRKGNTRDAVAASVRLHVDTFYDWMRRGKAGESAVLSEFYQAVKKAEADAEQANVAIVLKAARKTWQAAAWWLERRHSGNWRQRQDVKHTGGVRLELVEEITDGSTHEDAQQNGPKNGQAASGSSRLPK